LYLHKPIIKQASPSIVEPLLGLLQSLHLEVQYEAIELIKLLMDYDVKDALLKSLVDILKPTKKQESLDNANESNSLMNILN
jgi:hypothetical protein